ncbi:hypothetical protein [Rhodothermus profundi]|uniref:Uncharacterized protein n=1 Tax=Rhodothermus profundi TaxID=633813 RepID=A0A1M6SCP2_9BACT|nr:hypothetical protein [Rhodothermus profundi]SHK42491.1 hypothetical protein SAMN04488087_1044 [Rhodothermus profundi]
MRRLRHIGVLRGISLGLVLILLAELARPLWPMPGASYATWLRSQLQGVLAETILEAGVREALAARPFSLDAFVRAFLEACARQDGGAAVRAALGLPPDIADDAVLARLLELVPQLVAAPMLTPRWQASSGTFWASPRTVAVAFFRSAERWGCLLADLLPKTFAVVVLSPRALLFGAVLPMGP